MCESVYIPKRFPAPFHPSPPVTCSLASLNNFLLLLLLLFLFKYLMWRMPPSSVCTHLLMLSEADGLSHM